jgi:hypothetical protein
MTSSIYVLQEILKWPEFDRRRWRREVYPLVISATRSIPHSYKLTAALLRIFQKTRHVEV